MGEAQKQTAVFFTLIAFIILTFAVLLAFDLFTPVAILLVILVILIAVYSQTSTFFAQVDEFERVVVFRKGVFKEVAGPGWIFFIPFIESYKLIDLWTNSYDIPAQVVVTNDNILKKKQISENNFSFGVKEYLEIPGMEYQRNIGIIGFDATVVFKRAGRRVRLKKIKKGKISKRQIISKEEIIKFMEDNFQTQFI